MVEASTWWNSNSILSKTSQYDMKKQKMKEITGQNQIRYTHNH